MFEVVEGDDLAGDFRAGLAVVDVEREWGRARWRVVGEFCREELTPAAGCGEYAERDVVCSDQADSVAYGERSGDAGTLRPPAGAVVGRLAMAVEQR
eukprot:m.3184 g.3184  ORF g.3184 m.3184 type:complete len:97 (+) comp1420_c1_seq1:311-601(+)